MKSYILVMSLVTSIFAMDNRQFPEDIYDRLHVQDKAYSSTVAGVIQYRKYQHMQSISRPFADTVNLYYQSFSRMNKIPRFAKKEWRSFKKKNQKYLENSELKIQVQKVDVVIKSKKRYIFSK